MREESSWFVVECRLANLRACFSIALSVAECDIKLRCPRCRRVRLTPVSSSNVITLPVELRVRKLCALRCDLLPLEEFDKLLAAPCTGTPVVEEPVVLTTIRKFRIDRQENRQH